MNKVIRYAIISFFVLILFLILYILYQNNLLNVDSIRGLIESKGIFGPIIFILLYIVISLFGISAAAMTILAGTLFGLLQGLIIVVIAATISATIAFYFARFFSERIIKNKKKKDEGLFNKMVKKIEETAEKKGFMTIAILRLSFMPYILLSYAAGFVKTLKARDFILATFLTNIFGSFVFIFLGASIVESLPLFLLAIVLLILFFQVPKIVKKYHK